MERADIGSRSWAELKRRAGFEFNGMALHEYYFGNLATGSQLNPQSPLASDLVESWRTFELWRQDFARTGAMRGVGWAILYRDPMGDRLFNLSSCWSPSSGRRSRTPRRRPATGGG